MLKDLKKMSKFKSSSKKAGLAPGTIIHTGQNNKLPVLINLTIYNEEKIVQKAIEKIEEIPVFKKEFVNWLDVQGVHDSKLLEELGRKFGLHPLLLEDVANTIQRPKFESFAQHDFVVISNLYYDENANEVKSEQVTFVLGDEYVLSFQEKQGNLFKPIFLRIQTSKGKIRKQPPDFLLYSLMDLIVDNYFVVLEKLGEKIEELDEELTSTPTQETMRTLHKLKREIIYVRKAVWPFREVIRSLQVEDHPLVEEETQVYLRDLHDHVMQVIDVTETYRDLLAEMLDVYLSTISNRLNEVMKVLTIISTIFIPITFIASVYGMNFKYMPELDDPMGYWYALIIMMVVVAIMLLYFKRRKWL